MSRIIFAFVVLCSFSISQAQEKTEIEEGSILTLHMSNGAFHHINFPKANFIIKRGAIANFRALEGKQVIVEEKITKNNKTIVSLRRKDGKNFFRFYPKVTANLDNALSFGELKAVN